MYIYWISRKMRLFCTSPNLKISRITREVEALEPFRLHILSFQVILFGLVNFNIIYVEFHYFFKNLFIGELSCRWTGCWWTVLSVNRLLVNWVSANRPGPVLQYCLLQNHYRFKFFLCCKDIITIDSVLTR